MVIGVYNAEREIEIKFVHPKGPASYYWPEDEDICTVSDGHIICSISTATVHGSESRFRYKISDLSLQKV